MKDSFQSLKICGVIAHPLRENSKGGIVIKNVAIIVTMNNIIIN
jgi:hypothetical protein